MKLIVTETLEYFVSSHKSLVLEGNSVESDQYYSEMFDLYDKFLSKYPTDIVRTVIAHTFLYLSDTGFLDSSVSQIVSDRSQLIETTFEKVRAMYKPDPDDDPDLDWNAQDFEELKNFKLR
ncbi:hypothetical protein [Parasphingorhabdus sp.]|uniref:hypothetical protein n=1 Tax=Parasphingorhabdus sp. TaxID=2709688 RepID=UPI0032638C84